MVVVVDASSLDELCALEAADVSSVVFFFFFFLVLVELSDWLWSVDDWLEACCAARTLNVPRTSNPISIRGKYSLWFLLIPSLPPRRPYPRLRDIPSLRMMTGFNRTEA